VADEVERPDVGRQGLVLGRVTEQRAHLGSGPDGVSPQHLEAAVIGMREPQSEPDERRLARAVGPQESGDAGIDLDGHIGQGDHVAEALRDARSGHDRGHAAGRYPGTP